LRIAKIRSGARSNDRARTNLRRVNDAARMIGVGRTKLYELIAAGDVETVKLGKATRITTATLHDLLSRHRGV